MADKEQGSMNQQFHGFVGPDSAPTAVDCWPMGPATQDIYAIEDAKVRDELAVLDAQRGFAVDAVCTEEPPLPASRSDESYLVKIQRELAAAAERLECRLAQLNTLTPDTDEYLELEITAHVSVLDSFDYIGALLGDA